MYRKVTRLRFEDFMFPYGELDPENEWVKFANLVPWDVAEREYANSLWIMVIQHIRQELCWDILVPAGVPEEYFEL